MVPLACMYAHLSTVDCIAALRRRRRRWTADVARLVITVEIHIWDLLRSGVGWTTLCTYFCGSELNEGVSRWFVSIFGLVICSKWLRIQHLSHLVLQLSCCMADEVISCLLLQFANNLDFYHVLTEFET